MSLPGGSEWIIILLVVIIVFGAKKIPDLAKGLGQGIKEFKKAQKEIDTDAKQEKSASRPDDGKKG